MHDVTWLNHNWDSEPGPSRRPTVNIGPIAEFTNDYPEEEPEWEDAPEEVDIDDPTLYINFALLSNLAVLLRDKVPRGTLVKTSIPYPRAFTGKDIVSTIQSQIQRELLWEHGRSTGDRRAALQIARSLQSQLFFYEVEWDGRVLQDGVEDVYMFLDDEGSQIREELPSGLVTFMTRCYSPMCEEGVFCYSITCPRKGRDQLLSTLSGETEPRSRPEAWTPPAEVINTLPEAEIRRQTIIHKMISKEEQYIRDLDLIESVFIKPLQMANPPIMPPYTLEDFIEEVFGNVLDLRESNRRLLEVLYVRQREQGGVVQMVGDIFLDAAADSFREAYPAYIGHHPLAEKRLRDETEQNSEFRLFIERSTLKQTSRNDSPRLDLRHLLNRPTEHLQKYPVLLGAINSETDSKNPDKEYLKAAVETMKNLQNAAQLRTFQSAMGRGPTSKWEWHDLVPAAKRRGFTPQEEKRQATIFELIKGEMAYVNDLENIEHMYIQPLREAEPPIIPRDRLDQFLIDVFHNYQVLESHHRRLVEKFHEIQREHHPRIPSIAAAVFDAALNFREAYMEYVPNYPIAAYRIDDEMANNLMFRQFVERCVRHPDAHRLDMKNFINRPIPRLLRYELLLKNIMEESPSGHEDKIAIPQVIDVIKTLGKDTEPGVSSAKKKVELWRYNSNFVFKQGEAVVRPLISFLDMDLRNEQRSLIHTGKLIRQPENGWNEWTELFILFFDNYLVPTKIKENDGVFKYHVHRRPIPIDLITRVKFGDPPIQRTTGLIRTLRGNSAQSDTSSLMSPSSRTGDSAADARTVYPCTIHHGGRHGGPYILYAESQSARDEWKQKLEEALGLRKANKVFEIETLSTETFLIPHVSTAPSSTARTDETLFTGKVTCSAPFNTPDGRGLVAIGCAEGIWVGFRHDSRSMRRVLHLRMVTQCAILQDFGLFIVLADKQLFAYHIEALVPTDPSHSQALQTPQKLNGSKDAHFFSIGTLHGRTLVVYMKKRGSDSVFRALEPISDKIQERPRTSRAGGFFPRPSKKDWFREFREFVLPAESYDFVFLNAKVAVLCAKGFEIMDMTDFKSVTIPQREDSGSGYLARRCDACRPLGIFRCADDDYMLVYDEFGVFVNERGDPSRKTGVIEWEGKAEHVALHPPHILLFDSRFIEIRHLDTGRLEQIIPGKDVRCVWDERRADMGPAATPGEEFDGTLSQEPMVHAVMSVTEGMMGENGRPVPMRGVLQHVFELVPAIPLYLPGSSPPRPPHLRPSASYRL
ncbi:CNH domain-containing protein [Cyathus striatus]|nr:CNH domain-containing protein [Cyathus striatus]